MRHVRMVALLLGAAAGAGCAERGDPLTGPLPAGESPLRTVSPFAGQVVVNEIMVDPAAVPDASGEWLELHNRGSTSVDLQGWTITSNNDSPHTISASVTLPPAGYAVLARYGSPATNGGAPVDYAYGTGLTLANTSDWLALRDPSGSSVDSLAWAGTMPAGASRGVTDPVQDNTDARGANWHTATTIYGAGDKGTPGARNEGKRGELVVRVIDAGNADAIYIENGSSRVMLDGGQGISRIDNLISEMGLVGGTLDLMLISHAHYDHHGGLRAFFKTANDVRVRYVFENQDPSSATTLGELRDSIIARVGRGETLYRDTDDPCGDGRAVCTVHLDGGAKLHIMKPRPTGSVNDRSFPVKIVGPDSASFTMWASGDAEHDALAFFDQADYDVYPGMDVTVAKGNHHGSCNGISTRFLDLTSPSWITFGVSATNGYGHVHTQTLDLLRTKGIPWYRSDQNGRITFRTPGTPGGGYTVTVEKGSASMDGSGDATSSQSACSHL